MDNRLPVHRLAERLSVVRMTRRAWVVLAQAAGILAIIPALLWLFSTPAWSAVLMWVWQ